MVHAMLESVLAYEDLPSIVGTGHERLFTLSPGARGGWDVGDQQLILGVAVPVTWVAGGHDTAAFFYVSYELPFRK
jgi:hypothetical protein